MDGRKYGVLFKFIEVSISFAIVLVIVLFYIWGMCEFFESIFNEPLEYRDSLLTWGTVLGASAIVIGTFIRDVAIALNNVSKALLKMPEIQGKVLTEVYEIDTRKSKKHPNKKDGEEEEIVTISYDFTYL